MRAIEVRNISKQFVIGGLKEGGYRTLRDSIAGLFTRPLGRPPREILNALIDISFDVDQGEVVGVVGRNGAGKSTLFKILSRITEPTEGRALLHGRVGSLLEVGTGFHPELSGRENIFLNGAILGMSRAEIASKLDEIVAFAEISQFLETPVKRYSSGMYVRLAFAVAAHLNDDILIVDEVLAVGDARFQRKCLEKIEDVGRRGRTVLFVSHNMSAVTRLCSRALLLERGRLVADGATHTIVRKYLSSDDETAAYREWDRDHAPASRYARLVSVAVRDADGTLASRIDIRRPLSICLEWEALSDERVLIPTLHVSTSQGVVAFVTQDLDPAWRHRRRPVGLYRSCVLIPGNFLAEGTLLVSASLNTQETGEVHFSETDVVAFEVVDSFEGDSARGDFGGEMPGIVRPLLKWTNEELGPLETTR